MYLRGHFERLSRQAIRAAGYLDIAQTTSEYYNTTNVIIGRKAPEDYHGGNAGLWDAFDTDRGARQVLSDYESEQGVQFAVIVWVYGGCQACNVNHLTGNDTADLNILRKLVTKVDSLADAWVLLEKYRPWINAGNTTG